QFGAAFAGRADERHREARIEGHGDQSGLAVARDAFDANVLRIHSFVRLQIIESARGAPRPRTQRAPVIGLASLPFVGQSNDSLGEACPIVSLNAQRVDVCVAQPSVMSCSVEGGSAPGEPGAPGITKCGATPGGNSRPNIIITGIGAAASAGFTRS